MPGYVIHLAVAEEYLKKHNNNEENYNEFIEGVISPDNTNDKSKTHYGNGSSNTNLYKFILSNELTNSFIRGHFLHLLTDYLFYNQYIEYFSNDIYNDYDILNSTLINMYNVKLPSKIENQVFFKENGTLKIITLELVQNLITNISNLNIDTVANEIKLFPEKWTTIRPLKRLT